MSIHSITGKPGAGKSYEAVVRIIETIKSGRCVVTNLPLNKDHPTIEAAIAEDLVILYPTARNIEEGDTKHFGHIDGWDHIFSKDKPYNRVIKSSDDESAEIGPMIVVDEAQNTFNDMVRNQRKDKSFDKLTEIFRVHRHHLADIYLLYHDYKNAPSGLSELVERWHNVVNTSEMTGLNTYVIKTTAKGFVAGNSGHIAKRSGKFQKANFEHYHSYAEGTGGATKGKKKETGVFRSRPIWLRWYSILLFICLLALPFGLFKTTMGIRGVLKPDEEKPSLNFGQSTQSYGNEDDEIIEPKFVRNIAINEQAILDNLPQESVPILGFDNTNIYFTEGIIVNLQKDLTPKGWQVLSTRQCAITLAKNDVDNLKVHFLNYRCSRGF